MNAWDFVDALLEECETDKSDFVLPAAQVPKLREMIAEIPPEMYIAVDNGRSRKRQARGSELTKTRAIKMPENICNQIELRAARINISFNAMLSFICGCYLSDVPLNEAVTNYEERR